MPRTATDGVHRRLDLTLVLRVDVFGLDYLLVDGLGGALRDLLLAILGVLEVQLIDEGRLGQLLGLGGFRFATLLLRLLFGGRWGAGLGRGCFHGGGGGFRATRNFGLAVFGGRDFGGDFGIHIRWV